MTTTEKIMMMRVIIVSMITLTITVTFKGTVTVAQLMQASPWATFVRVRAKYCAPVLLSLLRLFFLAQLAFLTAVALNGDSCG